MQIFKIKVKPKSARLDRYLQAQLKDLSRSKIQKLIEEGNILVNKEASSSGYKVRSGDLVVFNPPSPKETEIKAEKLPVKVVYEDPDIIVVDKIAGMVVHPTADHTSGTLVNWLLYHVKEMAKENDIRPGIVHRLDKNTSGLLVVGKNLDATENLKKQFASRRVRKKYLALVEGKLSKPFGVVKERIGRHPLSFQRFAVQEEGKEAETDYRVLEDFEKYTLLAVSPKTGRTHQIRVHLSFLGHPIAGDRLYGAKKAWQRLFLHASSLEFKHPTTGRELKFESPLPTDLQAFLDKL